MRIRVIEGNCQGHNRCKAIAPDLFDLDEYGNASAANGGAVPPGQEDMARLAVENCPEFAIEIVEEGVDVGGWGLARALAPCAFARVCSMAIETQRAHARAVDDLRRLEYRHEKI